MGEGVRPRPRADRGRDLIRRFLRRFGPLLGAVLLLQTVLAPSLCLARGAGHAALVMEICGPDGLKRVAIGADGQVLPLPAHDPAEHGPGFCPACHAVPAVAALDPPLLPTPHWVRVAQADALPQSTAPRPPIRGPPLGAQAPPLS